MTGSSADSRCPTMLNIRQQCPKGANLSLLSLQSGGRDTSQISEKEAKSRSVSRRIRTSRCQLCLQQLWVILRLSTWQPTCLILLHTSIPSFFGQARCKMCRGKQESQQLIRHRQDQEPQTLGKHDQTNMRLFQATSSGNQRRIGRIYRCPSCKSCVDRGIFASPRCVKSTSVGRSEPHTYRCEGKQRTSSMELESLGMGNMPIYAHLPHRTFWWVHRTVRHRFLLLGEPCCKAA